MPLSCFLSSDCYTAWRSTQTSSAICGKRAPRYPCRQSLGEGLSSLFFFFFSVKLSVKSLLTLDAVSFTGTVSHQRGLGRDWNPGSCGEMEPMANTALSSPEWSCIKTRNSVTPVCCHADCRGAKLLNSVCELPPVRGLNWVRYKGHPL